jgi:hypothetical protein
MASSTLTCFQVIHLRLRSMECVSRSADQIGHLQRWPVHLFVLRRPDFELERIQRTRGCVQMALREVQVTQMCCSTFYLPGI